MPLSEDTMLGLTMRFEVTIDGVDLGGWASCRGLAVNFNPVEINEGGQNEHSTFLPGVVDYMKITLTRAVTKDESAKLMSWLAGKVGDSGGGTGEIVLFDARYEKVASWSLREVRPAGWKGPELNASKSVVAIESLELVHEGFL